MTDPLSTSLLCLALAAPLQGSRGVVDPYSAGFAAGNRALEESRFEDARHAFEGCLALAPEGSICSYYLACTAAREGRADDALERLALAVQRGYPDAAVASFEPDLASLRDDPAFTELLEAMRRNASELEPHTGELDVRPFSSLKIEALSPDGERFVSLAGSVGRAAFLCDRASAECLAVLVPPEGTISSARFGPRGELLVLNGSGGLTLWNASTGEYFGRAADPARRANSYVLTPDRKLFVAGWGTDGFGIWDVGKIECLGGSPDGEDAQLRLSPDGTRLLSVTRRRQGSWYFTTASLWDLEGGGLLRRFETIGKPAGGCGFSSSGGLAFFRSSYRGECHTIDVEESRSILATFLGDGPLHGVAFVPGSERIVATDDEGLLLLFDPRSGERLWSVELDSEKAMFHSLAAADPGGRLVLTVSRTSASPSALVRAWDLEGSEPVWELELTERSRAWRVDFTADGREVLLSSRSALWVAASSTGEVIERTESPHLVTEFHQSLARDAVVLSSAEEGFIALDLGTARPTARWPSPAPGFSVTAIDPTGRLLVGVDSSGVVHGIEIHSGRSLWRFPHPEKLRPESGPVVTFDPTGARLLLRTETRAILLDGASGEELGTWVHEEEPWIGRTAWSPDGERLAVVLWNDRIAILDDASLAEEREPLPHPTTAWSLAFLGDGRRLVTGSTDGRAFIWDLEEGQVVRELVHEDSWERQGVYEVLPHPDGEHLFTSTAGFGKIWCWEVESGALVWSHSYGGGWGPLKIHLDRSGERLFVPDGYRSRGWIFDALTGERLDDPDALPPSDSHLSTGGRFAVEDADRGVKVLRVASPPSLYTWHAAAGDDYLVSTPHGYYGGTPETARWYHAIAGGESHPLDSQASALYDPKRIAAIAAGVEVLPARLGAPPTVEIESPPGRFATVEEDAFVLEVVATDDEALLGFEVQQDGELLDPAQLARNVTFEADGHRVRLRLELPAPVRNTILRIRARDRRGLLSHPALLTVTRS